MKLGPRTKAVVSSLYAAAFLVSAAYLITPSTRKEYNYEGNIGTNYVKFHQDFMGRNILEVRYTPKDISTYFDDNDDLIPDRVRLKFPGERGPVDVTLPYYQVESDVFSNYLAKILEQKKIEHK